MPSRYVLIIPSAAKRDIDEIIDEEESALVNIVADAVLVRTELIRQEHIDRCQP